MFSPRRLAVDHERASRVFKDNGGFRAHDDFNHAVSERFVVDEQPLLGENFRCVRGRTRAISVASEALKALAREGLLILPRVRAARADSRTGGIDSWSDVRRSQRHKRHWP